MFILIVNKLIIQMFKGNSTGQTNYCLYKKRFREALKVMAVPINTPT